MISPDPVRDAAAYQASLLAALGDDDPAEVQSTTADAIRALVAEAGSDLRARPAPTEWSVLGCMDHIVDAEVVMAVATAGRSPTTSPRSSATTRTCGSRGSIRATRTRPRWSPCSSRSGARTSRCGAGRARPTGPGSRSIASAGRKAST